MDDKVVNGIKILQLAGRFDAHTAPQVRQWMDVATAAGPARIAVDLQLVNFIDSTALAALVQGMKRSRQQNGDLVLFGLQQPVRIIFELTRLDKAFAILEDETAALAYFD